MIGRRRQPGESWLEFYKRTMRHARELFLKLGFHKWSSLWLDKYLMFAGHLERLADTRVARKALSCRDLAWWRGQQALACGLRHSGRFRVWRWETRLTESSEKPWRSLAQNRETWWEHVIKCTGVVRSHDSSVSNPCRFKG